ncbi:MAG: PadR family transcriptional regulator [Christensenellales bacterium]
MDAQLKRGVIEACVLKLLTGGDSYGYQLSRDAADVIALSESALYPVLKRLEAAGEVESYTREHAGRLRRYYHLTEEGSLAIEDFLLEWAEITKVYDFIREGRA